MAGGSLPRIARRDGGCMRRSMRTGGSRGRRKSGMGRFLHVPRREAGRCVCVTGSCIVSDCFGQISGFKACAGCFKWMWKNK